MADLRQATVSAWQSAGSPHFFTLTAAGDNGLLGDVVSIATAATGREWSITSKAMEFLNSAEYLRGMWMLQFQFTPTVLGGLSGNRRAGQVANDDQAGLVDRLTALPWKQMPIVATDCDDNPRHGWIEHRTFQVVTAGKDIGFPYARQAIRVVRERYVVSTGQRSREVVYAICTAPFELAKPDQIAAWLRQHRGIENSVHYVRDWTYDEDRCSIRGETAPQIMAPLRNTAMNLHRLQGATNVAEACRTTAFTIATSDRLLQLPDSSH